MKDNLLLTGTIGIADIPFITNYEEVKKRLSIRLNNKERLLATRPEPYTKLSWTSPSLATSMSVIWLERRQPVWLRTD